MDNIIRLLVEAAEALDAQGLRAIADKVDKVANKTFDVKTAQYVGIQGYAIRNSRCWGNCYRQKRTSSPNKSAQQVWTECHKEYVESLNNDGSKWDKYAGSESNIKVGSELHAFSQEVNAKIASKVEEKVAEGLDIGSAVYASIEEVANEPNELMISASNEIMDIASRLVSNPEIAEKLTAAAEEMVKEAGIMDFFKGVGQGVKNWGSNQSYTGKLSSSITKLNSNFEEFKKGSIIQLTNKKNVIIDSITWIHEFTFADFKNFNFKYGQKVMTKEGEILNLLSVNFEIHDANSHCINAKGDDEFDRIKWLDLSEILFIYTPNPINLDKLGIS